MDIYDNIVNFLEMKNTGALLIVGAWGSGKTYYLDNVVFKRLAETEKHYKCIRVSLFGVKDTADIPYRVFQAYTDLEVNEKTGGTVKFDKVRDWSKRIYNVFPKFKEYVDLSPLFTKGNAAYSFVPNDAIICFDDIERATEILDINEILGAVNELVENRHFKVILVANKEYIDRKLQLKPQSAEAKDGDTNQQPNKSDAERELFYEKVVEKTIAYEPDIVAIYKELVDGYNDKAFSDFMLQPEQQVIVDPERVKNKKYRKQLQNIRTLKFAVEHFYQIWKLTVKDNIEDKSSLSYIKLHNYWLFTHAVAIEQKAERLKYDDDKGLSQAVNVVERVYLGDEDNENLFGNDEEDDDTPNVDTDFVKKFKKRHFDKFKEAFVFYKPIYDFLTASKTLDMAMVDEIANKEFNVQNGAISPANEILNIIVSNGFWNFTNEEAPQKLLILFDAVEKGELNGYMSYYNAGVFLFGLKSIYGKSEDEIKAAITSGVEKYSKRLPEVGIIAKTQIDVIPSEDEMSNWLKKEIGKSIDEHINNDNQKASIELENQFLNDMTKFASNFVITPEKTPAYFQVPILKSINLENVKDRIPTLEPNDVMQLRSFIQSRYLTFDCRGCIKELPFLQAIAEGIESVDLEQPLLSNYLIGQFLKPTLNKAIDHINRIRK